MEYRDITRLTVMELTRLIKNRDISPVEVTEAYLERIEHLNPQNNAYITICKEKALQAALKKEKESADEKKLGILFGLPLGVKDQIYTKNVRTTAGSKILADFVPNYDATVISKTEQAGAILVGKHNMTEFAAGEGDQFKYGEQRNPWDRERTVGGSSTGSAIATCTSQCAISLGEDTGGSIRGPASYVGIVGVRPTWGLVSRYGVIPISWSMDTIGPMTHTVEDASLVLNAIAGHDPEDPLTSKLPVPNYVKTLNSGIRSVRIGILNEFMDEEVIDKEVLDSVRMAATKIEEQGAIVEYISLDLLKSILPIIRVISGSDGSFTHRKWLQNRPQDLGPAFRRRWMAAHLLPNHIYQKAIRMRAVFRNLWLRLFKQYDALLSPTNPTPANKFNYESSISSREEAEQRARIIGTRKGIGITPAASLAGTPAMTIPCGFSSEKMPIGLQIMTNCFQEELMFRIGYAYEQITEWHTKRPPI